MARCYGNGCPFIEWLLGEWPDYTGQQPFWDYNKLIFHRDWVFAMKR